MDGTKQLLVLGRGLLQHLEDDNYVLQKELSGAAASIHFMERTTSGAPELFYNLRDAINQVRNEYMYKLKISETEFNKLKERLAIQWNEMGKRQEIIESEYASVSSSKLNKFAFENSKLFLDIWRECFRMGFNLLGPFLSQLGYLRRSSLMRYQSAPLIVPRTMLRQDEMAMVFKAMDGSVETLLDRFYKITRLKYENRPLLMWDYLLSDKIVAAVPLQHKKKDGSFNEQKDKDIVTIASNFWAPVLPHFFFQIVAHELSHRLILLSQTHQDISWLWPLIANTSNRLSKLITKSAGFKIKPESVRPMITECAADCLALMATGVYYINSLMAVMSKTVRPSVELSRGYKSFENFGTLRLYNLAMFAKEVIKRKYGSAQLKTFPCIEAYEILYSAWNKLVINGEIISSIKAERDADSEEEIRVRSILEPLFSQALDEFRSEFINNMPAKGCPPPPVTKHNERVFSKDNICEDTFQWDSLVVDPLMADQEYKKFDYPHISSVLHDGFWRHAKEVLISEAKTNTKDCPKSNSQSYLPMRRVAHEMMRYLQEKELSNSVKQKENGTSSLHLGDVLSFNFFHLVRTKNGQSRFASKPDKLLTKFLNVISNCMEDKDVSVNGRKHLLCKFAVLGPVDAVVITKGLYLRGSHDPLGAINFDENGISYGDDKKQKLPLHFAPVRSSGRIVWFYKSTVSGGELENCVFAQDLEAFFNSQLDGEEVNLKRNINDLAYIELKYKADSDKSSTTLKGILHQTNKVFIDLMLEKKIPPVKVLAIKMLASNSLVLLVKGYEYVEDLAHLLSKLQTIAHHLNSMIFFSGESKMKVFQVEQDAGGKSLEMVRLSRLINVVPTRNIKEVADRILKKPLSDICKEHECFFNNGPLNFFHHITKENCPTIGLDTMYNLLEDMLNEPSVKQCQTNLVWKVHSF